MAQGADGWLSVHLRIANALREVREGIAWLNANSAELRSFVARHRRSLDRYPRDAASLDANRRQDTARPDAMAQSFLACAPLCHSARAQHVVHSLRRRHF